MNVIKDLSTFSTRSNNLLLKFLSCIIKFHGFSFISPENTHILARGGRNLAILATITKLTLFPSLIANQIIFFYLLSPLRNRHGFNKSWLLYRDKNVQDFPS